MACTILFSCTSLQRGTHHGSQNRDHDSVSIIPSRWGVRRVDRNTHTHTHTHTHTTHSWGLRARARTLWVSLPCPFPLPSNAHPQESLHASISFYKKDFLSSSLTLLHLSPPNLVSHLPRTPSRLCPPPSPSLRSASYQLQ